MAFGLKVNCWKSSLMGINIGRDFMEMACNFLNYSQGTIPFMYLGLSVWANPKTMAMWELMLEKLSTHLNSWENKYVSLGDRIVLINSVVNSI